MLKKTYSTQDRSGRVTFQLPVEVRAETAYLCGEFNGWSRTSHPMMRRKNGSFTLTVTLPPGEYRFRYLLDGLRWENDWAADDYRPNEFGHDDSVVQV
jgi:1,4-alpha-glucan branching enzyme